MAFRITDLRDKQVLNIHDGSFVGYVVDFEFDIETGNITAMIIGVKAKGFSLFAKDDELIVPWDQISVIGNDSILISMDHITYTPRKHSSAIKYFLGS